MITAATRTSRIRQAAAAVALTLASATALVGCGSSANTGATSAAPSGATSSVQLSTELSHIHGAAVDSKDGSIIAGTHHGVWRITDTGTTTKIGSSNDDFMGFTVAGESRWLASGHPGPGSSSPNPLGLVESTDSGATWVALSRVGETDFHALAANPNTVVGFDGERGLIRSKDGGKTWSPAAALPVASLAYAGDRLLAVTRDGIMASTDDGNEFQIVENAPKAVLMSALGKIVWVIDRQGVAWSSPDAGTTWQRRSQVGEVSGLAAVDQARAYAITPTSLITVT